MQDSGESGGNQIFLSPDQLLHKRKRADSSPPLRAIEQPGFATVSTASFEEKETKNHPSHFWSALPCVIWGETPRLISEGQDNRRSGKPLLVLVPCPGSTAATAARVAPLSVRLCGETVGLSLDGLHDHLKRNNIIRCDPH